MIFTTIQDLSQDKYNRYEIALAAAKCARLVTNEYVHQRNEAEAAQTGNKETDKPLNTMIDKELRDEKAVKIAIARLHSHEYSITTMSPEEQEKAERAVLEGPERPEDETEETELLDDEDNDGEQVDGEPEETNDLDDESENDVTDEDAEDDIVEDGIIDDGDEDEAPADAE